MTSLAVVVAARMGTRAGELWRTTRTPTRNPFRHPAMGSLAAEWRRAYLVAATTSPGRTRARPVRTGRTSVTAR